MTRSTEHLDIASPTLPKKVTIVQVVELRCGPSSSPPTFVMVKRELAATILTAFIRGPVPQESTCSPQQGVLVDVPSVGEGMPMTPMRMVGVKANKKQDDQDDRR
jgi:hypothetical protein